MKPITRDSIGRKILGYFSIYLKEQYWVDATYWLILGSVGGLMPVWGGFFLLKLLSQSPDIYTFTQHGEFALYSASLLSAASYVITKEIRLSFVLGITGESQNQGLRDRIKITFPGHRLFLLLIIILLLLSSFSFAVASLADLPFLSNLLDKRLLTVVTLCIFIITIRTYAVEPRVMVG